MFEVILSTLLIEINLGSQIPVVTGGFNLRTSSMQEQSLNHLNQTLQNLNLLDCLGEFEILSEIKRYNQICKM